MLIARGQQHSFWHTNGCSCESVKVFETENVSTWGALEPPTFGFMPNALTYWAIRARHLLSYVLNTGFGIIDIFEVKLPFEMSTVCGQQHSFSTHERVFLWKSQSFWDRKCLDLRGTRPPTFGSNLTCDWLSIVWAYSKQETEMGTDDANRNGRGDLGTSIGTLSVNTLEPIDTIARHRFRSTLACGKACCLKLSNYYLNQYWLLIRYNDLVAISQETTKFSLRINPLKFYQMNFTQGPIIWHLPRLYLSLPMDKTQV